MLVFPTLYSRKTTHSIVSGSFLSPYVQEEKIHLGLTRIEPGPFTLPEASLSILPRPFGNISADNLSVFLHFLGHTQVNLNVLP